MGYNTIRVERKNGIITLTFNRPETLNAWNPEMSEEAVAALDRSLETLESQMEAVRESGGDPGPEPEWAAEARAMRERIVSAGPAGT